jgi:hypothetical protein
MVENDDMKFWFNVVMQCDGSCLVEVRGWCDERRVFLSSYSTRVLANGYVDDSMYGGRTRLWISSKTAATLQFSVNALRERNDFDPTLAPDRSFAVGEYFHG